MSGTAAEIATDAASVVTGEKPLERLIKSILSNRFAVLPDDEVSVWQVCQGSEMGLLLSGDLPDATLYARMERRMIDNSAARRRLGILR